MPFFTLFAFNVFEKSIQMRKKCQLSEFNCGHFLGCQYEICQNVRILISPNKNCQNLKMSDFFDTFWKPKFENPLSCQNIFQQFLSVGHY